MLRCPYHPACGCVERALKKPTGGALDSKLAFALSVAGTKAEAPLVVGGAGPRTPANRRGPAAREVTGESAGPPPLSGNRDFIWSGTLRLI